MVFAIMDLLARMDQKCLTALQPSGLSVHITKPFSAEIVIMASSEFRIAKIRYLKSMEFAN